jgi:hypothetical protein
MPLFRGQLKHIRGLTDYKDSVLVASTNNVGVTSTISSVDGVTLSEGDRILLVGQTTTTENGIYASQSNGTIARAFDADSTEEFSSGMTVYVEQGTSNGKSTWLLITTGEIVLGTTSLQFQKQSQIYDSLEGTYGGASKSLTLGIQKNGVITTVTENTLDSDNVTEGSSNLYHTTARTRSSISASGGNLSYNSSTGAMSFSSASLTPGTGISGDNFDTSTNRTFAIDTSVIPTLSSGVSVFTNDAGYITGYTVTESDVTTHQAALSITESQISDLSSYITASSTDTLTNKTIGASTISGNLIPDTTETYDLGSSTYRFNDLYLAGSTIDLGGAKLTNDGSDNLDIKDSSGNRKILRASAIELVDSSGKKIKIERDATSGKMKSRKFDSSGNAEADGDDVNEISEDKTPQLGGTLDANGNYIDMGSNNITDTKVGQWDTSYGWGDHASSNYLTDYTVTESDVTGHQSALSITESQISDLDDYLPITLSTVVDSRADIDSISQIRFILDETTSGSQGNISNTSSYNIALSVTNSFIGYDTSGIFYLSDSNRGTYEDIILRTNGVGTSANGFANPSGATSIFGFRGNSATTGNRSLTTASINTSSYTKLGFDIIQGTGSNGGEGTDSGDDFKIYYSTNSGSSYTLMQTYYGSPRTYSSWTTVSIALPSGAIGSSVKFKFENIHTASGDFDHWAISKVNFNTTETTVPYFRLDVGSGTVIDSLENSTTFTGSLVGNVTGNVTGNVAGNQSGGSVSATSGSFSSNLQSNGNFYANGSYTYLANNTNDRVYIRTPLFYFNNVLITATGTELNYVDGVTSNIQTQLNTKASLTGTETLDNKSIDGGSF